MVCISINNNLEFVSASTGQYFSRKDRIHDSSKSETLQQILRGHWDEAKALVSIENTAVRCFLAITALCNTESETGFNPFFNLWSVDVRDLDKYDFKSTNSCEKCPRIYLPVCGDDNQTYINECKMACLNELRMKHPIINMSHTGPCNIFGTSDRTEKYSEVNSSELLFEEEEED